MFSAQADASEASQLPKPSLVVPLPLTVPALPPSPTEGVPVQCALLKKDIIPGRSRFGLSFEIGGGLLWNYGQTQQEIVKDDGSSTKQATQIRVSQPHLKVNTVFSVYALDACQLASLGNITSSCVDFIVNVRLGVGNQFARDMRDIQTNVGVEGDFFFNKQRRLALTIKADVGYSYTFAPVLPEQAGIPHPFQLQPDSTHTFLIAASGGILINLGSVTPSARVALYADLQGAFYGGQFSFLVPIGIRFRF